MNFGTLVLIAVIVSVALITVATTFLFRFFITKLNIKELVEDGIVLTESGVEFPRFIFMGRSRVNYNEIESVELVHFPKNLSLRLRYGPSIVSRAGAGWFSFRRPTVLVKFKPPLLVQYRLFTPRNPEALFDKLKSKIEKEARISKGPEL